MGFACRCTVRFTVFVYQHRMIQKIHVLAYKATPPPRIPPPKQQKNRGGSKINATRIALVLDSTNLGLANFGGMGNAVRYSYELECITL